MHDNLFLFITTDNFLLSPVKIMLLSFCHSVTNSDVMGDVNKPGGSNWHYHQACPKNTTGLPQAGCPPTNRSYHPVVRIFGHSTMVSGLLDPSSDTKPYDPSLMLFSFNGRIVRHPMLVTIVVKWGHQSAFELGIFHIYTSQHVWGFIASYKNPLLALVMWLPKIPCWSLIHKATLRSLFC